MTAQRDEPKPRRRWLRFSLRTLLVVMLLLGVVFGALGMMANEARRQRKVVADLEELGADDRGGRAARRSEATTGGQTPTQR